MPKDPLPASGSGDGGDPDPNTDDTGLDPEDSDLDEGEPQTGDSSAGTPDAKKEVPLENRLGEYNRKLTKMIEMFQKTQERLDRLESGGSTGGSAPKSKSSGATSPSGLTEEQLWRAYEADPAKYGPQVLKEYIDLRLEQSNQENRKVSQYDRDMAASEQKALDRYEDLKDITSEFYQAVAQEVSQRIQYYEKTLGAKPPPDLVLLVANEVALSGNVKMSDSGDDWDEKTRRRGAKRATVPPQTGGSKPAATTRKSGSVDIPEKNLRIAQRTGRDLEKFKKFVADDPISQRAIEAIRLKREGK